MRRRDLLGAIALVELMCAASSCTFDPSARLPDGNASGDASNPLDADARSPLASDATPQSYPPIGHWTFNAGEELVDIQGNFPDLVLQGNAAVSAGSLDVNGSDSDASGWAVSGTDAGLYAGPPIVDKTLVSWFVLEQLDSGGGVRHGSVITLDRESSDHFDGIIFAERQSDRWMSGSSNFSRTEDFDPGFQETTTGTAVMVAVSYDDEDDIAGGTMQITGYHDGVEIGSYSSADGSSWMTNDAEVFFGLRHGTKSGGPGAIDARINEARIYDKVLTIEEILALAPL